MKLYCLECQEVPTLFVMARNVKHALALWAEHNDLPTTPDDSEEWENVEVFSVPTNVTSPGALDAQRVYDSLSWHGETVLS